jgi:23S rRNA (cytidine2498-2'-O)-methyltransferase
LRCRDCRNTAHRLQVPAEPPRTLDNDTAPPAAPAAWLLRIPEVFADWETEILGDLGAAPLRKLGRDYHLVRWETPLDLGLAPAGKFVRWNLPVHHAWPCRPAELSGFIEKAAQTLFRKFGAADPQTILVGPLDPGTPNRQYRTLGSNLRGRTLQLFPPHTGRIRDAGKQDSRAATLFCLIGREGLFCGMHSPLAANGFHPGGTKFIRQNAPDTISRAGAKIAEALHYLQLFRPPPPPGSHWLELGASPGGMTAELLARDYHVTAVDRAPLDSRLAASGGRLRPVLADAATFQPPPGASFDAVLSDMNGDALDSIAHIVRLSGFLRPGGLVVFTLKLPGVTTYAGSQALEAAVVKSAGHAGLHLFARTHLTYNRHEFTLFFERGSQPPQA